MLPLEEYCCQNPLCPKAGERNQGNLRLHGWSGHKQQIRCLHCVICGKYFSERKGTVFEYSHLPEAQVTSIMEHLREGNGVRGTGRLVKVCPNTVIRYARLGGRHAKAQHDELVALSPLTREVQLDEKWSFVYKKEAHCSPDEQTSGDNWDHTAIDTESRLLLSIIPGKRTGAQCQKVVDEVKSRTGGRTDIMFTTDEHSSYKTAIEHAYAEEVVQPDKSTQRVMPKDLCYTTVNKTRKGGRVVSIVTTLIFGTLGLLFAYLLRSIVSNTINTSFVERNNSTDRNQNARKGRKTMRFSKEWDVHNAMSYFVAYSYNFCWPVRTLRVKDESDHWKQRTPAMAAQLSDHIWSTFEWISRPARPCMSM